MHIIIGHIAFTHDIDLLKPMFSNNILALIQVVLLMRSAVPMFILLTFTFECFCYHSAHNTQHSFKITPGLFDLVQGKQSPS